MIFSVAACSAHSSVPTPSPMTSGPIRSGGSASPTASRPRVSGTSATTSPSRPPNVRPGEKAPVLPALARQHTQAGAVAFARYWVETLDWAYASMDTSLARRGFAASCSECRQLVGAIDRSRRLDRYVRGGRSIVHSSTAVEPDSKDNAEYVVDVTFAVEKGQVVSSDGSIVGSEPANPHFVFRLWIRWYASGWLIVRKARVIG
jgi:hypothetical protein